MRIAHGCLIYDNSASDIELLLRTKDKTMEFNTLDESQSHHVLIAEAVAKGRGVEIDSIFSTLKNP